MTSSLPKAQTLLKPNGLIPNLTPHPDITFGTTQYNIKPKEILLIPFQVLGKFKTSST